MVAHGNHDLRRPDGPRVSTLALGTMMFGTKIDEPTSFAILDRFREAGGTFLDTADCYAFWVEGATGHESEELVGRWLAARGCREEMVISTKLGAQPNPELGTASGRATPKGFRRRRSGGGEGQPRRARHRPHRGAVLPHRGPVRHVRGDGRRLRGADRPGQGRRRRGLEPPDDAREAGRAPPPRNWASPATRRSSSATASCAHCPARASPRRRSPPTTSCWPWCAPASCR